MKKIRIIVLAFVLVFVNNMSVIAAETQSMGDNKDYNDAYEEAYEEYKNDDQFKKMVVDYGIKYGEEFLDNVAKNKIFAKTLRGGGGNECYQYVKNIKQTKTYNCGSTTVLQTLYGLNSASAVGGESDTQKISTLDSQYKVDSQGSMMVYQAVDALNKYNTGNQTYTYKEAKNMTIDQFEGNIANSLTGCKPVILHAKTKYLSYYGGKNTGHYLSLDYVNRTSDTVRIVDCNYNSDFYGVHYSIPLSEAYNTIHSEAGRYLIY